MITASNLTNQLVQMVRRKDLGVIGKRQYVRRATKGRKLWRPMVDHVLKEKNLQKKKTFYIKMSELVYEEEEEKTKFLKATKNSTGEP